MMGRLKKIRRFLPRRFHAFCIGAPKSGTHSIAAVFAKHYRAAHEPFHVESINFLSDFDYGALTLKETLMRLRVRDRKLRLEMESSHIFGLLTRELAVAFPKARFIVTTRDVYSWLDSNLNHQLAHPQKAPSPWHKMQSIYFKPKRYRFRSGDKALKEAGLYPLESYVKFWNWYYQTVLGAESADRTLVIPTFDIGSSIERMVAHVGARVDLIDRSRAHSYKSKVKRGLITQVDPDYLQTLVDDNCSDLMVRLFPQYPAFKEWLELNTL